jgi:hypothetical protein
MSSSFFRSAFAEANAFAGAVSIKNISFFTVNIYVASKFLFMTTAPMPLQNISPFGFIVITFFTSICEVYAMLSHLGGHLWSVGHSCAHHEWGIVHMQLECVHIILIQVVHLRLHENYFRTDRNIMTLYLDIYRRHLTKLLDTILTVVYNYIDIVNPLT